MYLEGITVCVGYSDFLSEVLSNNLGHLDHLIVVTDTKDAATKRLCDFYNVGDKITCIQTDRFYENGATFNKGAGILAGLRHLRAQHDEAWALHFDSDVWFPPHLRHILTHRQLDPRGLYGIDRLMCTSYEAWAAYLLAPASVNTQHSLAHAGPFPVGSRIAHYHSGEGYFPAGYLQLWNPTISGVTTYPTNSAGADRTDALFSQQFERRNRQLLPDTYVIHLDSEQSATGTNWWGRRTPPFMPRELWPAAVPAAPAVPLQERLAQSEQAAIQDFSAAPTA